MSIPNNSYVSYSARTQHQNKPVTTIGQDAPLPDLGGADETTKGSRQSATAGARPGRLIPEMLQWLSDNREQFEFYLLHAMFHDPLLRAPLLATPVIPKDFRREEYSLVIGALINASKIMYIIGQQLPNPPSCEFLHTYLRVAVREEASSDEMEKEAVNLIKALQDPSFTEKHYCIPAFFEAWYGSERGKQIAKVIARDTVPDVHKQVGLMQDALTRAGEAVRGDEIDPYLMVLRSTSEEQPSRRPTGIEGLDRCLNRGWGRGECVLLFGGTSSGKSIVAAQCGWHEATQNGGYTLIVSTELQPSEYVARMLSGGLEVPIHLLQDCENLTQIRKAVMAMDNHAPPEEAFWEAQIVLLERVYVAKVHADDTLNPRALLKREMVRYERLCGQPPTLVILDWLGSVGDLGGGGSGGSADRAAAWETAATSCVKFAEDTGIPTLVLAQAVNDAQTKSMLTINDIGISKGIGKNMTAVIGLTNSISGNTKRGSPSSSCSVYKEEQWLCVCKARKGVAANIPVRRDFLHQRFLPRLEELVPEDPPESAGSGSKRAGIDYPGEVRKAFGDQEALSFTDFSKRLCEQVGIKESTADARLRKFVQLQLVHKDAEGKYRRT